MRTVIYLRNETVDPSSSTNRAVIALYTASGSGNGLTFQTTAPEWTPFTTEIKSISTEKPFNGVYSRRSATPRELNSASRGGRAQIDETFNSARVFL